jgi:hypothetical protein
MPKDIPQAGHDAGWHAVRRGGAVGRVASHAGPPGVAGAALRRPAAAVAARRLAPVLVRC